VRRTFVVLGSIVLAGCSMIGAEAQSTSVEAHPSGSKPAAKVYVKYEGPERLTRRFSRFFEIAADDYQISLASKPGEADARMEVTITEEDTHTAIYGKILHLGFLLRGGGHTAVHYCESTSPDSPDSKGADNSSVMFGLMAAKSVAGELKKSQPQVSTVYVDLIKGNIEPAVADAIKAEFAKGGFRPATNAASADAVLRTMGTTVEPIGISGTMRHLNIEISGATKYESKGSEILYKAVDKDVPERSRPCLSNMETYLNPARQARDDFDSAAAAARALAKH
jgi:hypothetical protein